MSLDALRGFDMFWIVGGDYLVRSLPKIQDSASTRALAGQMEHCEWAGFHFYDLIFPLFVFIVGISIPFSVPGMIARAGRARAIKRIVIRSVILFLLGVLYMGGVAQGFKNVYFAGVLHRIAVAYFFAALLFCFLQSRNLVAVCAGLLVGYWALMTFIPVPGVGHPDLSVPGKNLAHYIDDLYLPGRKFEGTILSTMAAVANCLLGVFAGLLLRRDNLSPDQKFLYLFTGGLCGLSLGIGWAQFFPVIKLLWTSSYVLISCGIGALLMAGFYYVIEMRNAQRWAQPFVWLGMNAITIYLAASILKFHPLAARFVGGDIARLCGRFDEFVLALATLALVFWFVYFLYRRKIFLRL
jgi:predicted acyltransferase